MASLDDPAQAVAAIEANLRRLAPDGVRVGARPIRDADQRSLHSAERAAIATAGPVRRREFATGRALLRSLLGADVAIPATPERRLALPEGWTATLAHDAHVAVAALAPTARATALGIDIEPHANLETDVAHLVVRPDDRVADALIAFVLKEATYKAWSGTGGRMLEHHDVHIDADPPGPSGAAFSATVEPDGVELRGRYASSGQAWLALVVIPA